jgi:hypothetical protein
MPSRGFRLALPRHAATTSQTSTAVCERLGRRLNWMATERRQLYPQHTERVLTPGLHFVPLPFRYVVRSMFFCIIGSPTPHVSLRNAHCLPCWQSHGHPAMDSKVARESYFLRLRILFSHYAFRISGNCKLSNGTLVGRGGSHLRALERKASP